MRVARSLAPYIRADLQKKMVFLSGPRQVGKTTLAQMIGETYDKPLYLNWDHRAHRTLWREQDFSEDTDLLILDEMHKERRWKRDLKGFYDVHRTKYRILVSGSARMDVYRRGGDSLLGRYFSYRLHPFSICELLGIHPKQQPFTALRFPAHDPKAAVLFRDLIKYGGFPEPLFARNERVLGSFHDQRVDRLVREDIRDIESVRDLSGLQTLAEILPEKVGSLLSLNALREDLDVAHKTVSHWTDILEQFYFHFRIRPYAKRPIRSLKKEPKLYLWDWSMLENESARLENIVASHILKFTHFLRDTEGHKTTLHFIRDSAGREVDFLVCIDRKPWFAVEVKSGEKKPSKHLLYFRERMGIPFCYQLTTDATVDKTLQGVRMVSVEHFLTGLA